jgi:hypothetical protein
LEFDGRRAYTLIESAAESAESARVDARIENFILKLVGVFLIFDVFLGLRGAERWQRESGYALVYISWVNNAAPLGA